MKKVFGVIGLGRVGFNVAKTLAEGGAEVIACDVDEEKVKAIAELVSQAFILDASDDKALKESGIANADVVIVSIGENIEASILVVVQLMELGVKEIIAKADTVSKRAGNSFMFSISARSMATRIRNKEDKNTSFVCVEILLISPLLKSISSYIT